MPHATSVPFSGFQALIFCGPGLSLNPFTSSPEDFPKALVPIANRPMVWYPIDWCYRMGVTNICLITPPSAAAPLEAALSQNPHLTSLPTPKPDLIAPVDLDLNTSTATILRLPEVKAAISGDFIILPCDLVCELPGEKLLDTWMVQQASLGGKHSGSSGMSVDLRTGVFRSLGGERIGRRGGLGVWYETTKPGEKPTKGSETDFVITTPLPQPVVPAPETSLRDRVSKLCYACTTDTLKDKTTDSVDNTFSLRSSLTTKHNGNINLHTTCRDAHIYLFPHWILDFIERNERLEILSEDVVGWWGKATWQSRGLARYLSLDKTLGWPSEEKETSLVRAEGTKAPTIEEQLDLLSFSSTSTSTLTSPPASPLPRPEIVPSILAYIHPPPPPPPPPSSPSPLLLRVDNPSLLLSTSLHLAALPPSTDPSSSILSPFTHLQKLHPTSPLPSHSTIDPLTVLLAPNTTLSRARPSNPPA